MDTIKTILKMESQSCPCGESRGQQDVPLMYNNVINSQLTTQLQYLWNCLQANIKLTYKLSTNAMRAWVHVTDLFHPISITKVHQLSADSLTLSKFITNDYLVTASDDGFVKVWRVEDTGLVLQALLISRTVVNQIEALSVNSQLFTISCQFGSHLVVWQLADFLFNKQPIYQPIFEQDIYTKKYTNKHLQQVPDTVDAIYIISQRHLVWQSKTQILLVDFITGSMTQIFTYCFPTCEQFLQVGWSSFTTDGKLMLFTFSMDEIQYIGMVNITQVISAATAEVKYTYVNFCKYQKSGNKENIKPIIRGDIPASCIRFVEIQFPIDCYVHLSESMQPNFTSVAGQQFIFSYANCSHFFMLRIDDMEQKFAQLYQNHLVNQTPAKRRPSQQPKSPNTTTTEHIMVVMQPYAFALHCIELPASLSEQCIIGVDNIKVSSQNYACCQLTIRNVVMRKHMVLFYDLNQVAADKTYYYPLNKVVLSGFGGAGISNQVVELQNMVNLATDEKLVYGVKNVWIITDAYGQNVNHLNYTEKDLSVAQLSFQNSDHFVYILSEDGGNILACYKYPSENYESLNQFSDICANRRGIVAISNNLGYIMLLGDTRTRHNSKPPVSSQFFFFETPGLASYKFSNQTQRYEQKQRSQALDSYIMADDVEIPLKQSNTITDGNLDQLVSYMEYFGVEYRLDEEKMTVRLSNQFLIILFWIYLKKNFGHLISDIKEFNIINSLVRQYDKYSNSFNRISQFNQLPCFYHIIQVLIRGIDVWEIVNEKQQVSSAVGANNSRIRQYLSVNDQNYSLRCQNYGQLNQIPHSIISQYGLAVIQQLCNENNYFQTNIQQNIDQLGNQYVQIDHAVQQMNLRDFKFVNNNVVANSQKYITIDQLSRYIQQYEKDVTPMEKLLINQCAEVPDCNYMGETISQAKVIRPKRVKKDVVDDSSDEYGQQSDVSVYEDESEATEEETDLSNYDNVDSTVSSEGEEALEEEADELDDAPLPVTAQRIRAANDQYAAMLRTTNSFDFNKLSIGYSVEAGDIVYFNKMLYRPSSDQVSRCSKVRLSCSENTQSGFYIVDSIYPEFDEKGLLILHTTMVGLNQETLKVYGSTELVQTLTDYGLMRLCVASGNHDINVVPLNMSFPGLPALSGIIGLRQIVSMLEVLESAPMEELMVYRDAKPEVRDRKLVAVEEHTFDNEYGREPAPGSVGIDMAGLRVDTTGKIGEFCQVNGLYFSMVEPFAAEPREQLRLAREAEFVKVGGYAAQLEGALPCVDTERAWQVVQHARQRMKYRGRHRLSVRQLDALTGVEARREQTYLYELSLGGAPPPSAFQTVRSALGAARGLARLLAQQSYAPLRDHFLAGAEPYGLGFNVLLKRLSSFYYAGPKQLVNDLYVIQANMELRGQDATIALMDDFIYDFVTELARLFGTPLEALAACLIVQ